MLQKRVQKILLALPIALAMWSSCSNDLVLVEPGKEVPVVYGIINPSDSVTYIRVERTFVDATKSGVELAKIADSVYYKNISVQLWRNNLPATKFTLERVDASKEGYPRDTGLFAQSPNVLYKIKNSVIQPSANDVFTLSIRREGATKPLTEGITSIVGGFEVDTFSPRLARPGVEMTETSKLNFTFTPLDISTGRGDKAGRYYDVTMVIYYDETDATGTKTKSLTWSFDKKHMRAIKGGVPEIDLSSERKSVDFLQFLAQNIEKKASVTRKMNSFDIIFDIGGSEMLAFQEVGAANAGITGSQSIPTYSNLSNGAFGLFSSRNRVIQRGYVFTPSASTLFVTSSILTGLNFR